MRILLVEDDPEMVAMAYQVLTHAGYQVDVAEDGRKGLQSALERNYSAIVLDQMLPQIDGIRVCAELRARRRTTPILMITARDSVLDRVRGLETGADDYLPKPFDVREFLARVRALIRREQTLKSRFLRVGSLTVDTRQRAATVAGAPFLLTRTEYAILELLASQTGRVVTRDTLLELIWQDREPGSNKLDVAIRSLRRKLESVGKNELIETIYGCGYTIRESEATAAP